MGWVLVWRILVVWMLDTRKDVQKLLEIILPKSRGGIRKFP